MLADKVFIFTFEKYTLSVIVVIPNLVPDELKLVGLLNFTPNEPNKSLVLLNRLSLFGPFNKSYSNKNWRFPFFLFKYTLKISFITLNDNVYVTPLSIILLASLIVANIFVFISLFFRGGGGHWNYASGPW